MIVEEMYIASAAAWLPSATSGAELEFMPQDCSKGSDIGSLYTEQHFSAAEMTVEAIKRLDVRSQDEEDGIDVLIHASTYHQGQDLAPLASTILESSVGGPGIAFEIKQMSNGGLCALHLAACLGAAQPSTYRRMILSAGERYCLPGIDRWRTDPGTPYGDGASAVLLSKNSGKLRILTVALVSDSSLQGLHQSNETDTTAPFIEGGYVQFDETKKEFMRVNSIQSVINRVSAGQDAVIKQSLEEAGLKIGDIDHFIVPHFGRRRISSIYVPLGIPISKTLWHWSRTVGHLGAADQFAGISELLERKCLIKNQYVMLLSVGAGYTWGAAILQVC